MIKTFRGELADGSQDTIRLSTNQGLVGYKILKLEAMGVRPAATDQESLLKVYTRKQTAVTDTVTFDDGSLIATCFYDNSNSTGVNATQTIVIDNVIVNQDLFITHSEGAGASACNYYIELEQVRLDLNEATVATLKDMRGTE
jgi:hypothetical protein